MDLLPLLQNNQNIAIIIIIICLPVIFPGHHVGQGALCPIHTADADATQLSSWVASAVCIATEL